MTGLMSVNEAGHIVIVTDRQSDPNKDLKRKLPVYDKNAEIEKIKRLLHNLIDRVDQLKTK